jgi:phage baseplate assembly protein W
MIGTHAATGKRLDGDAHLAQSIADILTTPLGTRLMRHDYGSLLPELIDQPFNALTRLRMFGAAAVALMRWEPRITLARIGIEAGATPGGLVLRLEGQRPVSPQATEHFRLSIPLNF